MPTQAMRRGKLTLGKYSVTSGDLLVLKSDKQLLQADKLKLSLNVTQTGLSEDSEFIRDIEVSKDMTLQELKEIVGDLINFSHEDVKF